MGPTSISPFYNSDSNAPTSMVDEALIRAPICFEFRIRDEAPLLVTNSPTRQPADNRRAYNNLDKHIWCTIQKVWEWSSNAHDAKRRCFLGGKSAPTFLSRVAETIHSKA